MQHGRPESLYPLFAPVSALPGIGDKTERLFDKIGAGRVIDLVYTLPTGVQDRRLRETLDGVAAGDTVTARVQIEEHRPARTASRPYRVVVRGAGQVFDIVYFRPNRDWIERSLPPGAEKIVSGKVEIYDGRLQMAHPDLVLNPAQADSMAPWEPVYPLTAGLGQRVVAKAVRHALDRLPDLAEWVHPSVIAERRWPSWSAALHIAHAPDGPGALAPTNPARQRLAHDELFAHQVTLGLLRARVTRGRGRRNTGTGALRARALDAFGRTPTQAQTRATDDIVSDMARETRMMRLLQGDVGSGKTLVALGALLTAVEAGGQATLMAPTEILARQHAHGLSPLADAAGVSLTLLTGRDKGSTRTDKIDRIADGRAQITVGTHALFQRDVAFQDLRLVVVDEQHRFGVRQRMELTEKAPVNADVLIMTATPIPRTLALAGYGDLDISVLDEKPPGRQPIATAMIALDRYDDVVARLRSAVASGQRAYWVCPLVEESEVSALTPAETRFEALSEALGDYLVRLVHGQMPPDRKDAALSDFQSGAARILVATTVVEVGVDVPEATIMVIEHPEHFGLAQLHQLRGRVGRGTERSSCLLLYAPPLGAAARSRLEIMRETEDGFRIAEEDLALRGAGDVLGTAQSGLPRFRVADLAQDAALMTLARDGAKMRLAEGETLKEAKDQPLRTLLYLLEREEAVRLMQTG